MKALAIVGEVVVAGGGSKRHRSRAGAAVLADGNLFVAYRVGRNMFQEAHGAVVVTRSADGGQTWEEPAPLLAQPGWDWFGAQRLLQLDDGTLLMLAGKARWNSDRFHTYAVRSSDGGRTWDPPGPEIRVFAAFSEPYGRGVVRGLPGGPPGAGIPGQRHAGRAQPGRNRILPRPRCHLVGAGTAERRRHAGAARARYPAPPGREAAHRAAHRRTALRLLPVLLGRCRQELVAAGRDRFHGHCPRLFALRHAIICVYRDMHAQRPGIGYSASWDGGGSWHYQGMLYRSPGPYHGWATACGYPSVLRLPDGDLLCVFHTDFVNDDCEIRAVRLREVN